MDDKYHSSRTFMAEHFYLHMRFVELATLSPYQNRLRKIVGRSIFIFFFNHAIGMQIYAIFEEYLSGGKNMVTYVNLMFETLTGIFMFSFYLAGIILQKEIKELLEDIVFDYENSELEARQIMKTSMKQTYTISKIFALVILCEGIVTLGCPFLTPLVLNRIFSTTYRPILSTIGNFGINRKTNPALLFSYNCICLTFLIIAVIAVLHAFITCIAYIVAKSRVVNYRFQKLSQRCHHTSMGRDESIDQIVYKEIKVIVKDHLFCYEFVQRTNQITSNMFLYVMFLFLLLITVAGSMIVIEAKKNDIENLIKTVAAFVVIMLGAFLMAYVGQKLVDISEDMLTNCYDCGWHDMSVKNRKMISFIILRNLRPCEFKAGSAILIDFENFTKLLNTSMSYITVMISLL